MEVFYNVGIGRKKGEVLIQSIAKYDQHMLFKGKWTPPEPLEMEISEGKKLYDIVGYQDTSNFAVSYRVYSLLNANNVTGWKGFEIRIRGVNERYSGFQVIGRCGKLIEPEEPGFCMGYNFDHSTWDRSDLFSPEDTSLIFCTKRVRDLLVENKITNVELIDISMIQNFSFGKA